MKRLSLLVLLACTPTQSDGKVEQEPTVPPKVTEKILLRMNVPGQSGTCDVYRVTDKELMPVQVFYVVYCSSGGNITVAITR
jgi:hypothetical protein